MKKMLICAMSALTLVACFNFDVLALQNDFFTGQAIGQPSSSCLPVGYSEDKPVEQLPPSVAGFPMGVALLPKPKEIRLGPIYDAYVKCKKAKGETPKLGIFRTATNAG